jgi:hypothetical protein
MELMDRVYLASELVSIKELQADHGSLPIFTNCLWKLTVPSSARLRPRKASALGKRGATVWTPFFCHALTGAPGISYEQSSPGF